MAASSVAPAVTESAATPNYASAVIDHIPSEAVAFYVFAAGLLSERGDATTGEKWIIVGIGFGVVIVAALIAGHSGTGDTLKPSETIVVIAVGALAFLAWSATMPVSPYESLVSNATFWGAIGAALVTLLAPGISTLALGQVNRSSA